MKLKKIASLMLAGVMAVSMLAGCSNGGNTEKPVEPTAGVNSAAVIAALDAKTTEKVNFAAGTTLQTNLEKAVEQVAAKNGTSNMTGKANDIETALLNIDSSIKNAGGFSDVSGLDKDSKVNEVERFVAVVGLQDANGAYTDAYVNKMLAGKIDTENVYASAPSKQLPATSNVFKNDDGVSCRYNLSYTGEVAVVEVEDILNGGSVYYAAFTVVRTATKATW